jgi:hypothetical protein
MINFDIFLTGLMVVSVLTSLVTEAVKKVLGELNAKFHANILAGIVSVALSIAVGVGYVVITSTAFSAPIITCIVALAGLSWVCAMIGYDKVVEVLKKMNNKG